MSSQLNSCSSTSAMNASQYPQGSSSDLMQTRPAQGLMGLLGYVDVTVNGQTQTVTPEQAEMLENRFIASAVGHDFAGSSRAMPVRQDSKNAAQRGTSSFPEPEGRHLQYANRESAAKPATAKSAVEATGEVKGSGSSKAQDYEKQFLRNASPEAKAAYERGERVMMGVRHETSTQANNGQGKYDDKVVVLQKGEHGPKILHEGAFNTDPSSRYEDGSQFRSHSQGANRTIQEMPDVNGDGRKDLARLKPGSYMFEGGNSRVGGSRHIEGTPYNVLRPVGSNPVERDTNHDGKFDKNDKVSAGVNPTHMTDRGTILIHRGGNRSTGSAGCQTAKPADFDALTKSLDLKNQPKVWYVLVNEGS